MPLHQSLIKIVNHFNCGNCNDGACFWTIISKQHPNQSQHSRYGMPAGEHFQKDQSLILKLLSKQEMSTEDNNMKPSYDYNFFQWYRHLSQRKDERK